MKLKLALLLTVGCMCAFAIVNAREISSGEAVVRGMYDQYKHSWYDTVKFTQKSTTYNPDGTTKVETWYEAALLPGKLRIDFGDPKEGNTAILTDGQVYFFQKGKLAANRPQLNLLLVLGFDVYKQTPETTIAQLKQEGIDLGKFHEQLWQGEPVYVVGADQGDLKSKQFWVEKKRMLFVRIIEPDRKDATKLHDTRFVSYRPLEHGLIAARVEMYSEDKLIFSEDYSEIQAGVNLDAATFDPNKFETAPPAK